MAGDAVIEKMLASIISTQDKLVSEVGDIRTTLAKIVLIEERQMNQKEALHRIGKHVDTVEVRLNDAEEKLHQRLNTIEQKVIELRITSAVTVTKITLISAGSSALVTGTLLLIVQMIFKANGG